MPDLNYYDYQFVLYLTPVVFIFESWREDYHTCMVDESPSVFPVHGYIFQWFVQKHVQ